MKSLIECLKNNTSAFGLMGERLQEVAEKIGHQHLENYQGAHWSACHPNYGSHLTIRLCRDYVCQHPETEDGPETTSGVEKFCSWCGAQIKPEKKMRWVESSIFPSEEEGRYWFRDGVDIMLSDAPGMIGFGGIQYQHPDRKSMSDFLMRPLESYENYGPHIPVKIRFWREQ